MHRINTIVLVGHENSGSCHLFRPEATLTLVITSGLYYRRTCSAPFGSWCEQHLVLLSEVRRKWHCTGSGAPPCGANASGVASGLLRRAISTLQRPIKSISPDLLVSLYTMHIYKSRCPGDPPL